MDGLIYHNRTIESARGLIAVTLSNNQYVKNTYYHTRLIRLIASDRNDRAGTFFPCHVNYFSCHYF